MPSASRGLKPKKPASNSSIPSTSGAAGTWATPFRTTGGSGERNVIDSMLLRTFSQKWSSVVVLGMWSSMPTMATSLTCSSLSSLMPAARTGRTPAVRASGAAFYPL
jgi:hypothetical protein